MVILRRCFVAVNMDSVLYDQMMSDMIPRIDSGSTIMGRTEKKEYRPS
jgi:hypothetical protein